MFVFLPRRPEPARGTRSPAEQAAIRAAVRGAEGRYRARRVAWLRRTAAAAIELVRGAVRRRRRLLRVPRGGVPRLPRLRPVACPAAPRPGPAVTLRT